MMKSRYKKIEQSNDYVSDDLLFNYFTSNMIIGFCKWIMIFAHIYCYKKNKGSLLPLIEPSGISFSTPLAHILNMIIPLYIFMLGSQNYYVATSQMKSLNIKNHLFLKMAFPFIVYFMLTLLLNCKEIIKYFSVKSAMMKISSNIFISKLRPGFVSLNFLIYITILIFSSFIEICVPNYNSIMEYKKLVSLNNSNMESIIEQGLLSERETKGNKMENIKLLNFNTSSIIKCVVTSIAVVYLLNILKVNDSNIFKLFMFLCIVILTISVGSFAFKQYLFETYVFLVLACTVWSSITLSGDIFVKSEILDLICSTLGVYLTIFAAGLFFSCIGIEIVSSTIYCVLFIPVFILSYNFSGYYITISPIFYPFYQHNSSIQKPLIVSWLSIIPFISLSLKLCIYINNNKKLLWFVIQLPELILVYLLPFTPLFEFLMDLNIHSII